MHSDALKSRILASYINAERRLLVVTAGRDVHSDYDSIRCEDVARWLIDHDPNAWATRLDETKNLLADTQASTVSICIL